MDSCGSDSDSDRRKVYMTTATDRAQKPEDPLIRSAKIDQERHYDRGKSQSVYALWFKETWRSRMLEATYVSEVWT